MAHMTTPTNTKSFTWNINYRSNKKGNRCFILEITIQLIQNVLSALHISKNV